MSRAALLTVSLLSGASAGADPDSYRKAPEGQQVFVSADAVQIGDVYEAFVIRFKDREAAYISPSRFRVAYKENVLQWACNILGCLHAHLLAREPGLSLALFKAALKAVQAV